MSADTYANILFNLYGSISCLQKARLREGKSLALGCSATKGPSGLSHPADETLGPRSTPAPRFLQCGPCFRLFS